MPIHFPGNILLTKTKGVSITATPEAIKQVQGEIDVQLQHFEHGPEAIERTVSHAYGRDPVVMRLLSLYLNRLPRDGDSNQGPLEAWPA